MGQSIEGFIAGSDDEIDITLTGALADATHDDALGGKGPEVGIKKLSGDFGFYTAMCQTTSQTFAETVVPWSTSII